RMLDALWAGQCNCAYWHGVFGGLYLPHLRQSIYHELIQAEKLADKVLGQEAISVRQEDFDKDGLPEVLLESPTQNVYVSPHAGGSIFEWDLRDKGLNMVNVLTRRSEGYHRQLLHAGAASAEAEGVKTIHDVVRAKEPELDKRLHIDWYRRA